MAYWMLSFILLLFTSLPQILLNGGDLKNVYKNIFVKFYGIAASVSEIDIQKKINNIVNILIKSQIQIYNLLVFWPIFCLVFTMKIL